MTATRCPEKAPVKYGEFQCLKMEGHVGHHQSLGVEYDTLLVWPRKGFRFAKAVA